MRTGNRIPTVSREKVKARERGQCLRCSGRGSEWAHRRRRNIVDEHQHCPCNGAWLCRKCHQEWAHAHPDEAREDGFIVLADVAEPGTVPVKSWHGSIRLLCDGTYEYLTEEEQNAISGR